MPLVSRLVRSLAPKRLVNLYHDQLHKETHINRALRRARAPTRYVEIGVQAGGCIGRITARERIGVDPEPFELEAPEWSGVRLHRITSDEYFDTIAEKELGRGLVDVAFVDGWHEFRQALRDVLNLERFMTSTGVIFIHDCNPPTRKHESDKCGAWTGDVWKVAYYLKQYRPDLNYCTLDCDWGLGMLSGFSKRTPVADPADVERVAALDYDFLAADRKSVLTLRSPLLASLRLPARGRVNTLRLESSHAKS